VKPGAGDWKTRDKDQYGGVVGHSLKEKEEIDELLEVGIEGVLLADTL